MKKVLFLAIILFSAMTSCISVQFANLDLQKPAQITFPKEVVNIAIVNNIPAMPIDRKASDGTQTMPIDSLASAFVDSLAYYLDKQQFFGQAVSYPQNMCTKYDGNIIKPLEKDQIQSICQEMAVDGLISVDSYQIYGSLTSNSQDSYSNQMSELAMGMQILLRSYTSDGKEIDQPILLSDTLYWHGVPGLQIKEFALPSLDEALSYINGYAVDRLLNSYTPSWHTEERVYFSNGSGLMKKASKLVESGNWSDAITIWEEAYKNEDNKSKQARIAYNLAVGYEATDNLDKAISWIRAAKNAEGYVQHENIIAQIDWYYNELAKRQVQSKKVKQQLGITETE